MKKIISILLFFALIMTCLSGCAFGSQTPEPTEPIDPEKFQGALIAALVDYLTEPMGEIIPHMFPFQIELGIIRASAQPDNAFMAQAYLAKADPESFYYMCGYYNDAHPYETSNYCCARSYTWVKFESADAIPESYNNEKLIVVFQISETKDCRNIMPVENTVPLITYFQEYIPEFLDGYNVAAPLFVDKFYVVTTRGYKDDYICCAEDNNHYYAKARACVVLDGVCYLTDKQYVEYPDGSRQDYAMTAGMYYEALAQAMITDKYFETDQKGNVVHYRLFKLDDVVNNLLNLEDE